MSTSTIAQFFTNDLDQAYIETHESRFVIGGQLLTFDDTRILETEDESFRYELGSQAPAALGVFFKYKNWPSVKISFPIGSSAEGAEVSSKGFKLGVHMNPVQNIVADIYYNKLSQFNMYDQNDRLVRPVRTAATRNIALNSYYIFNSEKFSYKHSFSVGQRQLRSAGSWMLGLSINSTFQEKETKLVDRTEVSFQRTDFSEVSAFQTAVLFGYAYNFIYGAQKRGFLSLGFFMGPNVHSGSIDYVELDSEDFSGVAYTFTGIVSMGAQFKNNVQLQFKVFYNDYGYGIPEASLRATLGEGELSLVKYIN